MPAISWVCGLLRCCEPLWGSFGPLRSGDRGCRSRAWPAPTSDRLAFLWLVVWIFSARKKERPLRGVPSLLPSQLYLLVDGDLCVSRITSKPCMLAGMTTN